MSKPQKPQVSSRKQPRQARSTELVAAILQAATQVLAREGATRFTTARVAEKAGVSIGSVYQYFPNKASILFRLQGDEWRQTTGMLHAILADTAQPPMQRLRKLVHAFVRSECEEADLRNALADAAPLYRDAPEAREVRSEGGALFAAFFSEVLPQADATSRALAADLVTTSLSAVGKAFSSQPRQDAEIAAYAEQMADMFTAYLQQLQRAENAKDT